jgi:hypothetical protein
MGRYWGAILILAACWQTPKSPTSSNPPAPTRHTPGGGVASRHEFLAVWGDNRGTSPQGKHQVFASRIGDDGAIVDPNGIAIDTRPHRARPTVLASPTTNGWWVASDLTDFSTPSAKKFTVSVHHVDGKGVLGARVQVSDVLRDSVDFDLATMGDDALVAWAGIRRTKTEAALVRGRDRTVVALPANTGRRPSVAFDTMTGNFVLAYREPSGATCVMIDQGGIVTNTMSIPMASPNVGDEVRVAPLGQGEVLLTWVEPDGRTITAARMDVAGAQITARATIGTAQGTVMRYTLVRGQRGFLLGSFETSPRGPAFSVLWLDAADPLGAVPQPVTLPIQRPEEMPRIHAGKRNFLITWTSGGEPYDVRVDATGTLLDAAPVSLRGVKPEAVPAATLQASLDPVNPNGTDYCPQVGHDRSVPPTVRGMYVVEGAQPWGSLYIAGFGWGGSTGSSPRRNFYVGRGPEFVPHFRARSDTSHPFDLMVEIPDAKRKRTEHIPIDHDGGKSAAAAGIAGPLDLVELEVNGSLGGKGLHFVITKATVIEDASKLRPRFVAARAELDKLVKASRRDLERVLGEAKRAAMAANPNPTFAQVPREESVVYMPTYRPSTGRVEILFGYRLTAGVMMKFPPPKPNTRPHKHYDDGTPPPNPRPLRWSVMMGARYTLDGDKIVAEEVWPPSIPGTGAVVPWQCTAPKGFPAPAQVAGCAGAPPAPNYVCVRDCGGPVQRDGDPPPGWSWLTPEQAARRKQFGCPICLPGSARVATPDGDVAIANVVPGMAVLSLDDAGRRVPATVLHVGSTLAGSSHRVVRVELTDGRVVTGSPGHPRADGGTLGELREGDVLDGARVARVTRVPLDGDRTWDILPSGPTGSYIIDGVVLHTSFTR